MGGDKEKNVYFAKLAEQAERYDEMADYMKQVGSAPGELSVEERNLLSVAYKNAVGSRRASWRIISSVEQKEASKGNTQNVDMAKAYRIRVETELHRICEEILALIDNSLIPTSSSGECKVLLQDEGRLLPLHRGVHGGRGQDRRCEQRARCVQGGDGGCDDGPCGDAPDPPRPGAQLLGVPLRGAREPGGGVQDGSPGVRGCHCRARQRQRGLVQGFDADHAAAARQPDAVDVGRRGR